MEFLKIWLISAGTILILIWGSLSIVNASEMDADQWWSAFSAFYILLGVSIIPTVFAGYNRFLTYQKEVITYQKQMEEWNSNLLVELNKIEKVMYKEEA